MGTGLWLVTAPLRTKGHDGEWELHADTDIHAYELTGAVLRQAGKYYTEITTAGGKVSRVYMTVDEILKSISRRNVPSTDSPS